MVALAAPQELRIRRFRTTRVILALMLRELGSRDSRSSLGFLWLLLEPVFTIILLSVVFSIFSRTPRLGSNFPLYYVTGILPFNMYSQISNRVSGSVRFSRQLLGFPSVTVMDALFARFILNFMVSVLVFMVLTSGIVLWYGLHVNVDIPAAIVSIAMAGSLAIGVGTFNSVLFIAIPSYENIWSVITRPMMLTSGVLFLINDLPAVFQKYLLWNPVAHVVGQMRHAFYPSYDYSYVSPGYVFLFSGIAFVLGLVTLQRYVFDALDS